MKKILIFFAVIAAFISCVEDSFEETATAIVRAPEDLRYANPVLSRANGGVKTGVPTYNSYNAIPFFVISAVRDGDGNAVSQDVIDEFITITNPEAAVLDITPTDPEDQFDENGEEVLIPIDVVNHRNIGQIFIRDGNPFGISEYSFDILMITENGGKTFQTLFENVLKVNLGPLLTSTLLYVPAAQNLLSSAAGDKQTTTPRAFGGNPAIRYELADNLDKFTIDAETGVITLINGYTPTEESEIIAPTINVISTISEEVVEFKDVIQIYISENPVEVPKQTFTVFYPEFAGAGDGYRILFPDPEKESGANWGTSSPISRALAEDRPEANSGQKRIFTNLVRPSGGNQLPHETWVLLNTQNLEAFGFGFDIELEFFTKNRFVEYFTAAAEPEDVPGVSPSFLDLYVSTDFTGNNFETATWTKVSDDLRSNVESAGEFNEANEFEGYVYPGDQNLRGFPNPEGRKDRSQNGDNLWTKSTLDITPYTVPGVTFAFRIVAEFHTTEENGETIGIPTSEGRLGQYWISDVNIIAKEQ